MELQQAQADTADLALIYVREYAQEACEVVPHGLGYRSEDTGKPLFWSPYVSAKVDPETGISSRSTRGNASYRCKVLNAHIQSEKIEIDNESVSENAVSSVEKENIAFKLGENL